MALTDAPAPLGHLTPDAPAPAPRCANCGTPAGDAFCPRCGQEQHDLHRSLRGILGEALDSLVGWDGKIPRTLWTLVRHPGQLTRDFLDGRRQRYLRPLRLYLTLSFVWFLTLSIDTGREPPPARPATTADSTAVRADAATDPATARRRAERRRVTRATAGDTTSLGARLGAFFERRAESLNGIPKAQRDRAMKEAFLGQLGNMLFALLPVFALLLRLAYRRTGLYVAEHFVFALHAHAFAMLAMTVAHFTPGGWAAIPVLAMPAHLWLSLRRVYGGSRRRTALTFAFLSASYGTALLLGITLTALVAFLRAT